MVVRYSLVLTGVTSVVCLAFDTMAAKGALLGGLASVLGFWIVARETDRATRDPILPAREAEIPDLTEEVENPAADTLQSARLHAALPRLHVTLPRKWFAVRMLLYTAALVKGYSLDTVHLRGFVAVAGALMVVRLVVTVVGVTGWDLKKQGVKSLES